MEGTWSSPVYAEVNGKWQVIFPGGDGWLYAFEAGTGQETCLEIRLQSQGKQIRRRQPRHEASKAATLAVHDNRLYTAVGQQPDHGAGVGHVWCVDITKTGDVSEELEKGKPNPNSGLKWHFGGPLPKGSDREWSFGRSISGFAVHDGLVYTAEHEGFMHCLDAETGKELWQDDVKGNDLGIAVVGGRQGVSAG